jgi:uncharacterized protein
MNLPEKRIVKFINKHHVLTLATCKDNNPWCASCFYAYEKDENCFIFTSDNDTKHVNYALINHFVAGSIVLETNIIGKIQGIQFQGIMSLPPEEIKSKIKRAYHKRFPYTALIKTKLWIVKVSYIKMTDNRLGFGKKLIWKSDIAE